MSAKEKKPDKEKNFDCTLKVLADGGIVDYAKFRIIHKHHIRDQFHAHWRCGTLNRAIRSIKDHDRFQLNGRKPIKKK